MRVGAAPRARVDVLPLIRVHRGEIITSPNHTHWLSDSGGLWRACPRKLAFASPALYYAADVAQKICDWRNANWGVRNLCPHINPDYVRPRI